MPPYKQPLYMQGSTAVMQLRALRAGDDKAEEYDADHHEYHAGELLHSSDGVDVAIAHLQSSSRT